MRQLPFSAQMIQLQLLSMNRKGQGMVEYGLILGLIAIACIAAMSAFGINMAGMFTGQGGIIQNIVNGFSQ